MVQKQAWQEFILLYILWHQTSLKGLENFFMDIEWGWSKIIICFVFKSQPHIVLVSLVTWCPISSHPWKLTSVQKSSHFHIYTQKVKWKYQGVVTQRGNNILIVSMIAFGFSSIKDWYEWSHQCAYLILLPSQSTESHQVF